MPTVNLKNIHISTITLKQVPKKRLSLIIILVILVLLVGVMALLMLREKNASDSTNKMAVNNTLAPLSSTQPLSSPNAGRVSGQALVDEVTKAKKDADALKIIILATPAPKNDVEAVELSKKNLELGKLYIAAMMYTEAFTTLTKVTAGGAPAVAEANYYMAKSAAAGGNKKLALQFYDQAIRLLEIDSQGTVVINGTAPQPIDHKDTIQRYKAEKASL